MKLEKHEETIRGHLQSQITAPVDSVEYIDRILDLAKKIEEKRDDLAYGAPATEKILQEKVSLFL